MKCLEEFKRIKLEEERRKSNAKLLEDCSFKPSINTIKESILNRINLKMKIRTCINQYIYIL